MVVASQMSWSGWTRSTPELASGGRSMWVSTSSMAASLSETLAVGDKQERAIMIPERALLVLARCPGQM